MKVEGSKGNIIVEKMMVVEERDGRITVMILRGEMALVTVTARGGARRQMRITQG
jgi:hypothetical protein